MNDNQPVRVNHAKADLRELLETNLVALHALLDEQRRALDITVRTINGLRGDLRALSDARAPWVKALSETRALLYVALRETVVANEPAHEPYDTLQFSRDDLQA